MKLIPLISSTFYEQLLRWYSCAKKLQSQIVAREELQKHFCTKKARVKCWWNWYLRVHSISSSFYKHLLLVHIPKVQKRQSSCQSLFALSASVRVKAAPRAWNCYLVDDVETPCPVEVEHWVEWSRMSIEEVFVVNERVGVAEVEDLLMGSGLHCKTTETWSRDCLQHLPHDLSKPNFKYRKVQSLNRNCGGPG